MEGEETATPSGPAFAHPALFYRGPAQFVAGVGGFVREATAAGDPVFVAVPGERLEALRDALGPAAANVAWADMTRLGRNPGRILAALRDFADSYPGRAVRLVAEPIWPGRTAREIREAIRHEALINIAFRGRTATVLCSYDVTQLPAAVVSGARRTHPTVMEDGRCRSSEGYTEPALVCSDCDAPLPEPPSAETMPFAAGQLGLVRDFVETWMCALPAWSRPDAAGPRAQDFVLAVSEAAANSIAHADGRGVLRLWREGTRLVAEISDRGVLADPLAGRGRPRPDSVDGGRGLWIIHRLCDLVEVRALPTGTTLRLHMETGSPV